MYIVPPVASKRKASVRKSPALRTDPSSSPEKRLTLSIAVAALAMSIAGASLIVDPRAEAAFDAPKRLVALIGIVVASVAILAIANFPPPRQWRNRPRLQNVILIMAVVAIAGAIVAAIASPRRAISVDAARVLILFALCLPLGASRALQGKRGITLLAVFIVASAINAAISIFQALGIFQPLTIESIAGRVTSVGLIGNEGLLGLLMAMGAVASLGLARFASSSRTRTACWAAFGAMLIALVASRNLTGWIALSVGIIPLVGDLLTTRRIFSWPAAIAIVVLLAGVIATPGTRSRAASLVRQARSGDWDSILSYRLAPWAAGADMIRERPILGFGPGTFGAEFVPHCLTAEIRWGRRFLNPQSSGSYVQAHSDYLDGFAEIGIPAGLAADAAVVTLIIGLTQIVGRTSGRIRHEALVVLAILLVGSVGALAWSTFQQAALAVPILIAAGRGWRLLGADARENALL